MSHKLTARQRVQLLEAGARSWAVAREAIRQCPKCGDRAQAAFDPQGEKLTLVCSCGYTWDRKPLDSDTSREVSK